MMEKVSIKINHTAFPSHFVSDSEKASFEFGLQVGNAIQYEWFRRDNNRSRYYDQWKEFHKLRLYARAEQPVEKYKNEIAIEGDLTYLNLDWTPVPILPKFVDIVVNGMSDRLFTAKAYAIDALSQSNRSKYQDLIEGQAAAKDILQNVQNLTGVNPFTVDPAELPSNDEELSLHMQLKYKPAIEIAEEEAINSVFSENHYEDVRKRVDYDQTVIGIGISKHEFLPGAGITISYVDPAHVVYSYTEDPFFRDVFYWGEVKTVPITEVPKIDPSVSTEDLEEISKYSQAWYDYHNVAQFYDNSLFRNDTCTLLYFNYKTTKRVTYKKKLLANGNSKFIEKEDTFNPSKEMLEEAAFEVVDKLIDVWYDGVMVMGTGIILKWELAKNMVRPKSSSQHAMPNYVACAPRMYKGVIESLVRRMIPFADAIQVTHLKIQQVMSRIVPDGIFLDADGINEVDLGTGGSYSPTDALRMYFQTGSVIGRSYTGDGEFNNARVPIQQVTTNSGANKLQTLIANYNHYLTELRNVTGLNEARDASTPDPHSLVGLQKLAALNSNTATRHLLDAGLFIYKSLAEAVTYRVSDILEYSDFKEDFINRIGRFNVSILDQIRDLYIYDFGVFIEVSPDEEQKAQLEENIKLALQHNDINLEDAIDIRELKNIKIANQLLKMKRQRNLDRQEQMEMQRQAMTAQQQLKSQEMAGQVAMQKIQAETQSKMQIKQAEVAFEIQKMQTEAELKRMLMAEEFQYNMQLRGAEANLIKDREDAKEKAKDNRISKQSTQQSELITQRQNNLPPINFESEEDTLDGFGLESFGPK